MPYNKTTMSEAISSLHKRTGNQAFYTDDECMIYINEGIRVWNLFTGYWRGTYSISSVYGQIYYDVNLLKTMRVEIDGYPIEKDSLFNLDFGNSGWQSDGPGTTIKWVPVGLNKIALNPPSAYGSTIVAIGVVNSPVCNSRDDIIDASEDVIGSILDYAQHIASFKSGGADFEASMSLYNRFVEHAGIQNSKFKLTSIYRNSIGRDLDGMMHPQWKDKNVRQRRSK